MAHLRNTQGLAKAAKQRRQETLKRTQGAIKKLTREGATINFNTVAAAAGVSKAWLYRETAISERIRCLRESKTKRSTPLRTTQPATNTSKEALISALKTRIGNLEAENRELKKQLEAAYGQLHTLTAGS